jgi:hypothetical protein
MIMSTKNVRNEYDDININNLMFFFLNSKTCIESYQMCFVLVCISSAAYIRSWLGDFSTWSDESAIWSASDSTPIGQFATPEEIDMQSH